MRTWTKEKPLTGTEGLIKDLHSTSNTKRLVNQSRERMNNSMNEGALGLIHRAPKRISQADSFVQVGVTIQKIVEGLLAREKRRVL